MSQLFLSLAQLALAVLLSALAAYLTFYLFQVFTRDLDEWEALRKGNPAVGLVLGALAVAVAIVLRPALVVDTSGWDAGSTVLYKVLLAEAIQLAIALILAVLVLALALWIFAGLTRGIDEVRELEKGNLAIAGLLSGIVIGIGLMVSQAISQVMDQITSVIF